MLPSVCDCRRSRCHRVKQKPATKRSRAASVTISAFTCQQPQAACCLGLTATAILPQIGHSNTCVRDLNWCICQQGSLARAGNSSSQQPTQQQQQQTFRLVLCRVGGSLHCQPIARILLRQILHLQSVLLVLLYVVCGFVAAVVSPRQDAA